MEKILVSSSFAQVHECMALERYRTLSYPRRRGLTSILCRSARARAELAAQGYTVLRDLLSPLHLAELYDYCSHHWHHNHQWYMGRAASGYHYRYVAVYRELRTEGCSCSLCRWRDPVAELYNSFFTDLINSISPREVVGIKPLTLFYGPYSWLPMHFDYYPFALAMSLQVGHTRLGGTYTDG